MNTLRKFLAWTRTVPGNIVTLELRLILRPTFQLWPPVRVRWKFDAGSAGYWFHFSYCYVEIIPIIVSIKLGLFDTPDY